MGRSNNLNINFKANTSKLASDVRRGFRGVENEAKKAAKVVEQSFGKATNSAINGNNKLAATVKKNNKEMTSSFGSMAKALLGIFSIRAAVGLISNIIQTGVEIDRLNKTLNASLEGYEDVAAAQRFLREESQRLGLVYVDQVKGYAQLSAAAKSAGVDLRDMKDIYLGIAEASTAMQLSQDDAWAAMRAVVQIMSKGKVQAEELRGQLGERLPGAAQLAARALGVTDQELNKLLETGKLFSKDFLPLFGRALRQEWGQAAMEASKSAQAALNRFKNAWIDFKNDLARSGALRVFVDIVDDIRKSLISGKLREGLISFAKNIADIAAALRKLATSQTYAAKATRTVVADMIRLAGVVVGVALLGKTWRIMVAGLKVLAGGLSNVLLGVARLHVLIATLGGAVATLMIRFKSLWFLLPTVIRGFIAFAAVLAPARLGVYGLTAAFADFINQFPMIQKWGIAMYDMWMRLGLALEFFGKEVWIVMKAFGKLLTLQGKGSFKDQADAFVQVWKDAGDEIMDETAKLGERLDKLGEQTQGMFDAVTLGELDIDPTKTWSEAERALKGYADFVSEQMKLERERIEADLGNRIGMFQDFYKDREKTAAEHAAAMAKIRGDDSVAASATAIEQSRIRKKALEDANQIERSDLEKQMKEELAAMKKVQAKLPNVMPQERIDERKAEWEAMLAFYDTMGSKVKAEEARLGEELTKINKEAALKRKQELLNVMQATLSNAATIEELEKNFHQAKLIRIEMERQAAFNSLLSIKDKHSEAYTLQLSQINAIAEARKKALSAEGMRAYADAIFATSKAYEALKENVEKVAVMEAQKGHEDRVRGYEQMLISKRQFDQLVLESEKLLQAELIEARKSAMQKWADEAKLAGEILEDVYQSTLSILSEGIGELVTNFKELSKEYDNNKEMFRAYASSFLRQIAKMIIQQTILNALQSQSGGFSGAGIIKGIASAIGGAFGGGAGASTGSTPYIPAAAEGGILSGPKSGYPAMLHGTEAVIPLNKMSGMGGVKTTINVAVNGGGGGGGSEEDRKRLGKDIAVVVKQAFNENLRQEMRPGGMLNRSA